MSSYPQPLAGFDLGEFNSVYFSWMNQSLSLDVADQRYLHQTGGHITGSLTIDGVCDVGSLTIGGSALDLSMITGITHGIVSADKAVIVNATKDISGFRNISASSLITTDKVAANYLQLGSSTDTTRQIACSTGGTAIFTLGAANSQRSQTELKYTHAGLDNDSNMFSIGFYGTGYNNIFNVMANKRIGINTTIPAYALDINGDVACNGNWRNGSTILMDSSGLIQVAAQSNITSVGTLTSLSTNGFSLLGSSINLQSITTINNSCIWTSGAQPTTTNGIGIRFNGLANGGTGYIRAYNYIMSSDNNIDINNGNIYVKNNRNVAIDNGTTADYKLHVNGVIKATNLLLGTSTDTNRLISALGVLSAGGSNQVCFGYQNSAYNQCELSYYHAGDGSTSNQFRIGWNGGTIAYFQFNNRLGIMNASPSYTLDVNGDISASGAWRNGSTILMDNTGKVQSASQPNITSVGTLSSLMVSGALSASTLTGTLQTAAQPNITSLGTLIKATIVASTSYTRADSTGTESALRVSSASANCLSAAGTDANIRCGCYIPATVLSATNATTTNNACSLFIAGDPSTGSNMTITNPWAIWCNGRLNTESLYIQGQLTNLSALTNITAGTVSASKAVIVDASKNISGYNNIQCAAISTSNTQTPLYPVHISTVGDRLLALYNTGSLTDYYGFGAASSRLFYYCKSNHRFFINSTGSAQGDQIVDIDSSGLLVNSGYALRAPVLQLGYTFATDHLISACNSTLAAGSSVSFALGRTSNTSNEQGEINFTYQSTAGLSTISLGHWGTSHQFWLNSSGYAAFDSSPNTTNVKVYIASPPNNTSVDIVGAGYQLLQPSGLSQSVGPVSTKVSLKTASSIWVPAVYVSSDRRLKRDIQELKREEGIRFVQQCEPVRYVKKDTGRREIGWIAQELLRKGFYDIINFDNNADMHKVDPDDLEGIELSVDYSRVASLLHAALRDILCRIEDMKQCIDEQADLIHELREFINTLDTQALHH